MAEDSNEIHMADLYLPSFIIRYIKMYRRPSITTLCFRALFINLLLGVAKAQSPESLQVHVDTTKVLNTVRAELAHGGALDGMEAGSCDKIYRPEVIEKMLSAGLGPISYRLRTDLGIEAWHWSDEGVWSDAKNESGYWVSSAPKLGKISKSNGFHLPHRGTSGDQANNLGYSRLDDGDLSTFWKSNPYLDEFFTHEDNHLHPQRIVIDLGKRQSVNALKIAWGDLYATDYDVEYWQGDDVGRVEYHAHGKWSTFPQGHLTGQINKDTPILLSSTPIQTRYLKILLYKSAENIPQNLESDLRTHLGFSIREIYAGKLDKRGTFTDYVKHAKSSNDQSTTFASSTDPWHRAMDRDKDTEQPGVDLVGESSLTRNQPWLMAVGTLYDIPENAVSLLKYLRKQGYPISGVELGEEPDGQYIEAEDYGALYIQFAEALHAIDPELKLGGPSFQTVFSDVTGWPEADRDSIWLERFLKYLHKRGHLSDFSFLSFEWYYNDDLCAPVVPQLNDSHQAMLKVFEDFKRIGIPKGIPLLMTEYGYTPYAGEVEVNFAAALFNVDSVAAFLSNGGTQAFFYGYEPSGIFSGPRSCGTYGALTLFRSDWDYNIKEPVPAFYATQMLNKKWLGLTPGNLEMLASTISNNDRNSAEMLSRYALRDSANKTRLLFVNRNDKKGYALQINQLKELGLDGQLEITQYAALQYSWKANRDRGHSVKNEPPRAEYLSLTDGTPLYLPPWSIVVVRAAE